MGSDPDPEEEEQASDPDPSASYLVGAAAVVLVSGGGAGAGSQGEWGCMEVAEGEGRREEGSTGRRARSAVSPSRGRPGEPAGKRAEERRRRDRVWGSGRSECGRERVEAAGGAGGSEVRVQSGLWNGVSGCPGRPVYSITDYLFMYLHSNGLHLVVRSLSS